MAMSPVRTRRDRWADWAVIAVLVVALLLGWAVMALAQGQRDVYTDPETGLILHYPQGWLVKTKENVAFEAVDTGSGDFNTTFVVRTYPIDATAPATATLAMMLNNASLTRAQTVSSYRLFDVEEGRDIGGRPSMEASYVYVEEGLDLFVQQMPVVVLGRDVAVARGDRAYVFSLLAAKDSFEGAAKAFRRFIESAEIQ